MGEANSILLNKLRAAREQTDQLFEMVQPQALYDRPIAERHRLVFYVGHLEAFDWNMVCRRALGIKSFHPEFDKLFEFGIDPGPDDLPADHASDWPSLSRIDRYRARTRRAIDDALQTAEDLWPFSLALEHRLMHAETLAYLLHRLPLGKKVRKVDTVDYKPEPSPRAVEIPAGEVTLGRRRVPSEPFGWDNEFSEEHARTSAFAIDVYNVTNRQFLEFVSAGSYGERSLWSGNSWAWIRQNGIEHPNFWRKAGQEWMYETMFSTIPLPLSWPVYVSHAEAEAYARWQGRALPTEAQYHRAAFGTLEGQEQDFPWGDAAPESEVHGNFDGLRWNPQPVGSYREGNSAFRVADLMSNGWEWTSTVFAPLKGFLPFRLYPGYSANFFDGGHYVLKGASPRTSAELVRRTFRNWFQPHYPNVYAKFRCVEN
jgi:gamma-glutamyl hercynylcysteine S-oxide synthase